VPTTSTFKAALLATAKRLCQGRDPIVVTATGGSTTTIVVSSYAYSSASAHSYNGVWAYVATDAGGAGAAPEGEIRRVTRGGFNGSTGTWTVSPAFTVSPAAGDTIYFLYGPNRQGYLDAWNEITASAYAGSWLPYPNLVTDGDMETSGVGSWTDVETPSTKEKVTTATRVFSGTSALHVVTNAVDEGVISDSIPVIPGEHLIVSGAIAADSGDVNFQLYDVTNSVVLEQAENINYEGYAIAYFTRTVPTGCEHVAVRILSDATAVSDFYVGYVQVLSQSRTAYVMPATFDNSMHIEDIFSWGSLLGANKSKVYIAFSNERHSWPHRSGGLTDWQGANSHRVEIEGGFNYPLFATFRRNELGTSTTDASTTTLPLDTVTEGMLGIMYTKQAARLKSNPELMAIYLGYAAACNRTYKIFLKRDGIAPVIPFKDLVEPTTRART
jgi:hypothetical protein